MNYAAQACDPIFHLEGYITSNYTVSTDLPKQLYNSATSFNAISNAFSVTNRYISIPRVFPLQRAVSDSSMISLLKQASCKEANCSFSGVTNPGALRRSFCKECNFD